METRNLWPRLFRSSWLRVGLILVAGGALAWLSLAVTLAQVLAERSPSVALSWWPNSAARAALSTEVLGDAPGVPEALRARSLALAALRRSPSEVAAYRNLAVAAAAEGKEAETVALTRSAERLSRRDLQTQLMLIEISVRANDLGGALTHYDRVLRVRPAAQDLLFPVLVQAANDPEISRPLLGFLIPRPIYWGALTDQIIAKATDMRTLGQLLAGLKLDPGVDLEHTLLVRGMNRLVGAGAYSTAYDLYLRATPGTERALLRDGDFDTVTNLAPFDWTFADGDDLQAGIGPGPDGGNVLLIAARAGRGEAARQLVLLPPGAYRLSAIIGGVSGDTASWPTLAIYCANNSTALATVGVAPATVAAPVRIGVDFVVPTAACAAQVVRVTASGALDGNDTPWVDKIAIERR